MESTLFDASRVLKIHQKQRQNKYCPSHTRYNVLRNLSPALLSQFRNSFVIGPDLCLYLITRQILITYLCDIHWVRSSSSA